ncbi:MAG: serine/threonine protein kinase [Myxococcaceae bacterium]|nr:serine/threonine protein kinase [Myxococcaceae bacterium]
MSQRNAPPGAKPPPIGVERVERAPTEVDDSDVVDGSVSVQQTPKTPSAAPQVPQAAAPKRGAFSRPPTPTTPFSPQNALHQALAEQTRQATARARENAPPRSSVTPSTSNTYAVTPPPPLAGPAALPTVSGAMSGAGPSGPPPQSSPMSGPMSMGGPLGSYTPGPPSAYPGHASHPPSSQHLPTAPTYNPHGSQPGIVSAPPTQTLPLGALGPMPSSGPAAVLRTDSASAFRAAATHIVRSRAYAFVLDARGLPIEIGSGRFGKVYLGEERWLESKTDFRRTVVIKVLQKGVSEEDLMRFQIEKELLERVQGHPNIVKLFSSGEGEDVEFLPISIRDKVESEFVILEKLEMSLEERLKGSRALKGDGDDAKDDLLGCSMNERIFRVMDYMIPIASAIEFAHLIKNMSHRDIKPANILIGLPDPTLRGSTLEVRLADFNVAKMQDGDVSMNVTRMNSVPGTLFFQSPEQETNVLELLVNVQQGSAEVEYFEDFYIQIAKNDTFSLFNRGEAYPVLYADRAKKKLVLGRPWRETSEANVRAKIQKSVGRPADIYSLGALFYYLVSGAYANPKTLYDNFHKFIEYERAEENNTIEAYLEHEYSVINSMRAPKTGDQEVAPADRFFSYKHYLDGNGELIDPHVMRIIAKCMIRNKPDSYCQAHDVETRGISDLVQDLIDLYTVFGVHPSARPANLSRMGRASGGRGAFLRSLDRFGNRLRWMWLSFLSVFRGKKK